MPDTETLTEEQLVEIEARRANASPHYCVNWEKGNHALLQEGGWRPLSEEQPRTIATFDREHGYPDLLFCAEAHNDIPALCRSLRAAWAERNEAYVSERENCNMLEQLNVQLTTGLVNIYHVVTGEQCKHGVALGMATSAVSSMLSEIAALRTQNQTQAESIIEFQGQLKEAHANVESLSQIIFRSEHAVAMRDACVATLRQIAADYDNVAQPNNGAAISKQAVLYAARQIESLTLDPASGDPL